MTTFDLSGLRDGVQRPADAEESAPHRIGIPPPPRRPGPSQVPAPAAKSETPTVPAKPAPGAEADDAPTPATNTTSRRPRTSSSVRRGAKTTIRLFTDQPGLLRELAERHEAFRTEVLAAAIDRYLPEVAAAGPIYRPPRRARGPLAGEELTGYHIAIDGSRWNATQRVADDVSDGDCSAVLRAVLDRAFTKAGFELGRRPDPRNEASALLADI